MEKENVQEVNVNNSEHTKVEDSEKLENENQENNEDQTQNSQTKQEEKRPKREINLEEELRILKRDKEEGDRQIQIDLKKAVLIYNKALDLIDELKETNPEKTVSDTLLDYKKRIISNLALANFKFKNYEKSIEYDLIIINDLDKNFDKSYARLIKSYVCYNDLEEALNYYSKMFKYFNKHTLEKYKDVFKLFEDKCKEHPKLLKEIKQIQKSNKKWGMTTWLMIIGIFILIGVLAYSYFGNRSLTGNNLSGTIEEVESNDILSN